MKKHESPPTLPHDIQEVIRNHMNEKNVSRAALARELGVSPSTLYRYIHRFGGTFGHKCHPRQPGTEAMIRQYYPHYSAKEIADMKPNGITLSRQRINALALRYGVEHSPETRRRLMARTGKCGSPRSEECKRRISIKRRRLYRMEYLRHDSGMPQKTKVKLRHIPARHYKAAWRLENVYRYIITTDPYVLWYDEGTHRTSREQYFVEKYGFTFEQAQD